jgi:hypothetical protein
MDCFVRAYVFRADKPTEFPECPVASGQNSLSYIRASLFLYSTVDIRQIIEEDYFPSQVPLPYPGRTFEILLRVCNWKQRFPAAAIGTITEEAVDLIGINNKQP